jgi:Y_Y_Y domain/Histidine kinase/Two component regulator propeller
MRYFFTIIFCLWFALGLSAQAPRQFLFTPYNEDHGLPSNHVNDIIQDQEGFLWLATAEGLVRFDGTHYKLFRSTQKDKKSYPFSYVHSLHLDQQQRLWLINGYWEMGYFDTKTFRYTSVDLAPEDPSLKTAPKGIIVDTGRDVLLGLGSTEILVFDEKKQVFRPAHDFFPRKPEWKIQLFWRQPGTNQYCAYITGQGAILYDRDTKRLHVSDSTHHNLPYLQVLNQFEGLHGCEFDRNNRIWLLRWRLGIPIVSCYDLQLQKFIVKDIYCRDPGAFYHISRFFTQKNGTFWAIGGALFSSFDESKKQFVNIASGTRLYEEINYSSIMCMYEDRDQNLWIGTDNEGLYRFNPGKKSFSNVSYFSKSEKKLSVGSPLAYLEDPDGSILISVWGEGFYRYDRHLKLLPTDIQTESIMHSCWDICLDRDPNFAWFGAQPGIYLYDRSKRSARYFNPPLLQGSTVRQVEMDLNGNLWFGTQTKGVFKWNRLKGKIDFVKGLSKIKGIEIKKPVNQITIDSKGWVWIATGEYGMYVVDSKTDRVLMHFNDDATGFQRIPEPGVSQVLEYNDSIMVFATSKEVLVFNRKIKKTREIIHDENIKSLISILQKDQDGNIWMGTLNKLYRFHPYKSVMLEFDRKDGIFEESFSLSSSNLLRDGRIIMGCDRQFIIFDPKKLKYGLKKTKARVTDIAISGQVQHLDSLLNLEVIELNLKRNNLHIDFSALTFDNLLLQYKLDGLDKDWVNADEDNHATYNYIPPGTYRFLLRTVNSEMVISPAEYQFSVKIYPPFYRASWFYALLLLALVGTVLWFDAERMRRKAAVEEVRNKIATDLHQEVNTALQNINILSEMANLKAEQDPQKSKEFMAQIQNKSNKVIDAMNDMLWGIAPENDSMKKTLLRMEEQIERLQNRHDAQIDLLIEAEVKSLKLDMRKRYGIFLLFKEGAKGLLSVCPQGYRLHVFVDKKDWVFTAYCEQKDYDTIALNNLISRSDLRQRILALNAHIQVTEEPMGFIFEFRVPIE